MKEAQTRICKKCGMKFTTTDGRVKTCHRHKPRYNEGMKKKNAESKTLGEVVFEQNKKVSREHFIMVANFILNIIIALGVTCNVVLNIVK